MTGSPWSRLFQPPKGFRYRQLMPVTKTGPGRYRARQVRIPFSDALTARTTAISSALRDFRPDLLLVDNVPCGLAGELLPALEAVDARTRALYDDYLAKSRLAGTALRVALREGARLVEAELERHNAQMGRRW